LKGTCGRFGSRLSGIFAFLFSFCFLIISAGSANCEQFFYRHRIGDKYRFLTTVNEDIFINRQFNHKAEIINRIAVELTDVSGDSGSIRAVFQTAEKATNQDGNEIFQWSKEYVSEFDRSRLGNIAINSNYFMPVVRNVPVFPDRDLNPGDTWSAEGYEIHDFRDSLGIQDPYRIPFNADYVFLGTREWKGKAYPAFSVSYRILSEPAPPQSGNVWPRRIQGSSDQVVYWDTDLGQEVAHEENFRLIFEMSNSMIAEYRGTSQSELIEAPVMNKEMIANEVLQNIQQMDIKGATVRVEDAGVTISIENIQFLADSAQLGNDEKLKLDKITGILNQYPDRDILVSGYTAMVGTKEMQDYMSLQRATSVAGYLIEKNVRTPDRIIIRGYGADKPIADNDTEAGRSRNRRVEITILEN